MGGKYALRLRRTTMWSRRHDNFFFLVIKQSIAYLLVEAPPHPYLVMKKKTLENFNTGHTVTRYLALSTKILINKHE